jgi:hypothetical protein
MMVKHLHRLHTVTTLMSDDSTNSDSVDNIPEALTCMTSISPSDLDPPLLNEASGLAHARPHSEYVDDIRNAARNDDFITRMIP